MDQFFIDYLKSLEELHNDICTAIKGLPVDDLDWSNGDDMNSLSVLVVHSIGAERYWIGDVIMGDTSARDRESEFAVRGLQEAELVTLLQKGLERRKSIGYFIASLFGNW